MAWKDYPYGHSSYPTDNEKKEACDYICANAWGYSSMSYSVVDDCCDTCSDPSPFG